MHWTTPAVLELLRRFPEFVQRFDRRNFCLCNENPSVHHIITAPPRTLVRGPTVEAKLTRLLELCPKSVRLT